MRGYVEQDEREVQIAAARWLLPVPLLAQGISWSRNDRELAAELWVDPYTL